MKRKLLKESVSDKHLDDTTMSENLEDSDLDF